MQDNENQGRVLFRNPSARTTPEAVANQVLNTGKAEVSQIQRSGAEREKQINDFLNGINTLAKGSIQIQEKQNAKTIQSIDSARELSALNLQNEFLNIDKLNIPIQEKFAKKQEVINNFKLNGLQTQQALQQNKGMWQKILGTEDDFNTALQNQVNKQKKFEMSLDELMVAEAQKTETELTKQNIANIIKNMQNAGTENGILNAKNVALNNINQAFKSGKISEAEVLSYKTQAFQNADNQKVKVTINNAIDKALINGDFNGAINDLSVAYNEVMQKEGYNKSEFENVGDRPVSATEIRNALFQLQNNIIKKVSNTIPLTASNSDIVKAMEDKNISPEEKEKIFADHVKRQNPMNGDERLKYFAEQKELGNPAFANLDPNKISDRRAYLNEIGKQNYTALTKNEINFIQTGHNQIGVQNERVVNGQKIKLTDMESYGEWLTNYISQLGNLENAKTESYLHNFDYGTDFILNNINEDFSNLEEFKPLINIIARKNRDELKKTDSKEIETYKKNAEATSEYKFLEATGRMKEANNLKEGQSFYKANMEDKNYFEKFKKDYIYLVNQNMQLKIPNQDGNGELKKAGVQAILNTPYSSLGLTGNKLQDNNVFAETSGNDVIFYKQNKYDMQKVPIKKISLNELVFTNEQIKQMQKMEQDYEDSISNEANYKKAIQEETISRQKNKQRINAINERNQKLSNMSPLEASRYTLNRFNNSQTTGDNNFAILEKINNTLKTFLSETKRKEGSQPIDPLQLADERLKNSMLKSAKKREIKQNISNLSDEELNKINFNLNLK